MEYIVVRMDGKNAVPVNVSYGNGVIPPHVEDQSPTIFHNVDQAKHYADAYTKNTRIKHQVRPAAADKDWAERERKRLESGEYVKVLWHDEAWVSKNADCVNHFVHVSKEPANIAFTESAQKGERDAQTRMSPSKYLNRYYSHVLTESVIREWCARHRKEYGSDYELKFAYSADDIEHVYKIGPGSCMQGVSSVRAYAGPDLAVAYIERKGKITARAVAWPEKKLYCSCVYGDANLLTEVLHEEGYKASYRFKGARMSLIKDGNRIILPSIEMAENGYDYKREDYVVIK